MMESMNRKTLETFRAGVLCGAEAVREQASRIRLRAPWTYRKPMGASLASRPWLVGLVVFSSVLTALTAYFYFRKRRQVADHYNMATDPEAESWEAAKEGRGEIRTPTAQYETRFKP